VGGVSPSQASASPTHLLHKGRVALEVTAVVEDDLQPARTRPSTRLSQCASSSSRRTSHRALRVVLPCGLQRQHGAHGLCMTRTHARHSPSSSPQIGPQFSGVLQRTPSPRPALLGPPCSARPARPALLGPPCSARPAQPALLREASPLGHALSWSAHRTPQSSGVLQLVCKEL
jgi:hypothetical protein